MYMEGPGTRALHLLVQQEARSTNLLMLLRGAILVMPARYCCKTCKASAGLFVMHRDCCIVRIRIRGRQKILPLQKR